MINLVGKSVFVRTQEEYESILKMAKLQGFTWTRGVGLTPLEIPLPNMLNFYADKSVTYNGDEKLLDASEIVEDKIKLKEAIAHVKYFSDNKNRMDLTDKVIDSMLLLANTVESQIEEAK